MSLRLAWVSDPHLDILRSPEQLETFLSEVESTGADRVLISGDISNASRLEDDLILMARRWNRPIDFVLGNHDFYGGGIGSMRQRMRELSSSEPLLNWLPASSPCLLSPGVALTGHDGWADGRLGDFLRSELLLNDYLLIQEFQPILELYNYEFHIMNPPERLALLNKLGDEAAEWSRQALGLALEARELVIFLTHVPPFEQSALHGGRPSGMLDLPHFTSKAMGDVLLEVAAAHPQRTVQVLCGHTHAPATFQPLPNLLVHTSGAVYGKPTVTRVLEID
mgnify:CR=1 FL=1